MRNLFTIIVIAIISVSGSIAKEVVVDITTDRDESVYINLNNENTEKVDNINWDISFITGINAAIHVNGGQGVKLWHVSDGSIEDFDAPLDTTGKFEIWEEQVNSPVTWDIGAFNLGKNGFEGSTGDFGWGQYAQTAVTGTELFVIQLRNGDYKKIAIEELLSGVYYFKYSDLNNENQEFKEVSKSSFVGKLFGYYDLQEGKTVDREPISSNWDLEYSYYVELLDAGPAGIIPYPLVGFRSYKNVKVAQLDGVDIFDAPQPKEEDFSYEINTIGHDWKTFDFNAGGYVIEKDRVYYVQRFEIDNSGSEPIEVPVGELNKLIFTDFDGGGETTFELNSTPTSVSSIEYDNNRFAVSPNIINKSDKLNLIYAGSDLGNASLSIYSSTGNKVYSSNIELTSKLQISNIETSDMSSGIYFVRIQNKNAIYTQKFIVK